MSAQEFVVAFVFETISTFAISDPISMTRFLGGRGPREIENTDELVAIWDTSVAYDYLSTLQEQEGLATLRNDSILRMEWNFYFGFGA